VQFHTPICTLRHQAQRFGLRLEPHFITRQGKHDEGGAVSLVGKNCNGGGTMRSVEKWAGHKVCLFAGGCGPTSRGIQPRAEEHILTLSSCCMVPIGRHFGINDTLNQLAKELHAFKKIGFRIRRIERDFGVECPEESLCVGHIAHAVHVSVFHLCRALSYGESSKVSHELLYEPFEERHGDDKAHCRETAHEQADIGQVPVDRQCIGIGWGGMGGEGEPAQHRRMRIAHFLKEIVEDNRTRFF